MVNARPLSVEPEFVSGIREALNRTGYSAPEIRAVLGELGSIHVTDGTRAAIVRRTSGGSPLDVMLRLFLAHGPVPTTAAEAVLAPLTVAQCVDGGLLELKGSDVSGAVTLRAFDGDPRGAILASDVGHNGALLAEHVVGVGIASIGLSGMTIRRPSHRSLDLGTGTGVQAMHASLHSDEVVATDRSARAVNFTEFNLALNDVTNVDVRLGDRFDPVAGEQFDLIVSNPPFVISPSDALIYRDSSMEGDDLCRSLVRHAPDHLAEGGWCQLLANWAYFRGDDWRQRLGSWFEGLGCDAWVIQRGVDEIEQYAVKWIEHGGASAAGIAAQYTEWMDYYSRVGIEAVGFGLITMRRHSGTVNWLRIDDLRDETDLICGDAIAHGFELEDWVRANGAEATLLASRLIAAPDIALHRRSSPGPDGWTIRGLEIRLSHGLRRSGMIDSEAARIVTSCDGTRTLGDILAEVATSVGVDPAEVARSAVPLVLRLVEQGYLLPARQP
ncbi:MAG: methyltransferase [Acidimicrobiales bacterium]